MLLDKENFQAEFNVSRETMSRFQEYHDLLIKWGQKINLISLKTKDEIWERHFSNSARFLNFFDKLPNSIIDMGSGAGFPGLVIARLLKDKNHNYRIKLVDENHKRIAFLREAIRILDIEVEVSLSKIEIVIPEHFEIVTARAFAPLDKLLHFSYPYSQLGARLVFLKGIDIDSEIKEAKLNWHFNHNIKRFDNTNKSCIIEILELRHAVE